MKSLPFIILFVFSLSLYAQDITNISSQVKELKQKIKKSNNKEQLKLLDSLTSLVWRKKGFNFDSLAIKTIDIAIKQDTTDLAAYHVVNRMYYYSSAFGDLNKSEAIFNDFRENHFSKVKIPNRILNFYKAGGLLYYNMDKYKKSLFYYEKALKASIKTTNNQGIGEIYMGKGMVFYNQGKLVASSQNLQKSIPYFKKSKSINAIINVKNVMVSLYSENGFYAEAAKEREEVLALAKKEKHYLFLSQIYFNYAVELGNRDKLEERIHFIELALENVEQSRYKAYYKPIYLAGMVSAYSELDNLSDAQKYFDLLEKESRKNSPGETTAYYKEAKMKLAFANKNYSLALKFGEDYRSYKAEIKQFDGLEKAEQFLSKTYTILGKHKKANQHLKNYQKINDSITGYKKAQALIYYQTLYETEKRDAKITEQQSEITLLDVQNKIKTQKMLFGALALITAFILIITYRTIRFAKKKQLLQQQFARSLLEEQEKERKRVSKELHDGVGQNLLLIKNSLTLNPKKTPTLVDKTLDEIRTISRNLHPIQLEKFGLTKAIENIIDDLNDLTTIFFTEEIDNIDHFFPKEKEIYLYRIIQECINNIIKHSGASAAKITIKKEGEKVTVTIQDNGSGFDFEKNLDKQKSFGLKSLQERVAFLKGKISFNSEDKKGTLITIISYK